MRSIIPVILSLVIFASCKKEVPVTTPPVYVTPVLADSLVGTFSGYRYSESEWFLNCVPMDCWPCDQSLTKDTMYVKFQIIKIDSITIEVKDLLLNNANNTFNIIDTAYYSGLNPGVPMSLALNQYKIMWSGENYDSLTLFQNLGYTECLSKYRVHRTNRLKRIN